MYEPYFLFVLTRIWVPSQLNTQIAWSLKVRYNAIIQKTLEINFESVDYVKFGFKVPFETK